MKFTKEQACEKLTAILTNDSKKPLRMSERSLQEQTEDLMNLLADDETELDAFIEKVKPTLERFNSNVEHDVSEGIRAYRDSQQHDSNGDGNKKTESAVDDERLKLIEKELLELKKERDAARQAETAKTKKEELKKWLSGKEVNDDEWVEGMIALKDVNADTDVEQTGQAILKLYNRSRSEGGNITPGLAGKKTGDGEGEFSKLAELRKQRREAQSKTI